MKKNLSCHLNLGLLKSSFVATFMQFSFFLFCFVQQKGKIAWENFNLSRIDFFSFLIHSNFETLAHLLKGCLGKSKTLKNFNAKSEWQKMLIYMFYKYWIYFFINVVSFKTFFLKIHWKIKCKFKFHYPKIMLGNNFSEKFLKLWMFLGTGILAMHQAFHNSGWLNGLISIVLIGFVCTYCFLILVRAQYR